MEKPKLKIKPLKQNTEFGCLATCYAMIKNYFFGEEKFNKEIEGELCKQAFSFETGDNAHFYIQKLVKLGCKAKILVETPYAAENVHGLLNSKFGLKIPIEHAIIGIEDYRELLKEGYVVVTLIDKWQLDMYVHSSHYIIVSGIDDDFMYLTDPFYGKEIRFSRARFTSALESLKQGIGFAPVIFAFKR